MGLPWIGFIGGFIIASLFRRPHLDVRALAIEVGIQNTGISIFLLRFALPQPEGDLTTGMNRLKSMMDNTYNSKFLTIE